MQTPLPWRRRCCDFLVLQYPSVVMGHEDRMEPRRKSGIDVRFRAVADHPGNRMIETVLVCNLRVGPRIFLGHDFTGTEEFFQSRALDLPHLLGGDAFGPQDQMVALGK